MYNFVDTTERYPGQNLPSEALMFNGNYLENVIPDTGHCMSGREIINTELTELEVGALDGARYRRKRYPSRTIVVGYQLIAEDNGAFRNAYNKLNALLDEEQATLIFADEPDKFSLEQSRGLLRFRPVRTPSHQNSNFTAQIHLNIPLRNLQPNQLRMAEKRSSCPTMARTKHFRPSRRK